MEKESTPGGLLMTIVRRLLFSSDVGQREQEKSRLEKQYQESDRRLDNLIQEHLSDVMMISQAFTAISSRITASQERIRAVKDGLQSCKNLLHCKRDELRRLWIEGVEMKTVHASLDAVEQVKDVAEQIPGLIAGRKYLTATELVISSLAILDTELSDVDALQQVKVELSATKDELYERLMEELHTQIYVRPSAAVLEGFQKNGSSSSIASSVPRPSHDSQASYLRQQMMRSPDSESSQMSSEMTALRRLMDVDVSFLLTSRPTVGSGLSEPDSEPVVFTGLLVESLSNLHRLPDAVELLKARIQPGLISFIQRATQHVADSACIDDAVMSAPPAQPQLLLELLDLVFRHSQVVAQAHAVIIAHMTRTKNTSASFGDFSLYDSVEVWTKIQAVLQTLLADYLDVHNTASRLQHIQPVALDDENVDIASYFTRKRPAKPKRYSLFRFDASSHALSISSYLREREQRHELAAPTDTSGELMSREQNRNKFVYVCRRWPANITTIYNSLQKYLVDIAGATNVPPSSLPLHIFIRDFIRNAYLGQVIYNIEANISQATKSYESRRSPIELHAQRELSVIKPLLRSTVLVARSIQELCELMTDLPDYASHFVNMICRILQEYLDSCQQSYHECFGVYDDVRRITSAVWVKDNDINSFLRSLPSWQNLKPPVSSDNQFDDDAAEQQMSDDDLYLMNSKESSVLTSNLLTNEQSELQLEIISDTVNLRALGNLCESMEWFSERIESLATSLSAGHMAYIIPSSDSTAVNAPSYLMSEIPSESTITTLRSLARHYVDISELCILALHVEVRMHCFHHLLAIAHGPHTDYHGIIDKMEPDENVTRLNKDLAAIDDVMQQTLQHRKFRYIFEGLGHLVSTILINTAQYLKRINENGIKKMCRNIFSIQQCLTNITSNRESDLDHARQYYELLYLSPDEIVKSIVNTGQQFTEQQYVIVLGLSHRSEYGSTDTELVSRLAKLNAILTAGATTSSQASAGHTNGLP